MTEQLEARDLMRAAYDNRYTWDSNFPGYTTNITLKRGDEVFTATAKVNPDLSAEVSGIADEAVKKAMQHQLWEIAIHRIRREFEDTHGKNTFSFGETDETGAVELLVGGKADGDRYQVRDREVTLVHRKIRDVIVTINTFSTHDTGDGYLSHRYDSIYRDPETREVKGGYSVFEDNYEKVGDYYILTSRVIQTEVNGQTHIEDYSFSNVKLLEPALV